MTNKTADLKHIQTTQQLILNAAGEGIYGLDENGLTTFLNAAAVRILGWHEEDVIGQPLHEVHHHSHADGRPYPREECPVYAALKDGEVHQVSDEVFWHADGHPVPVEYVSTPIWVDGTLRGAVVLFRDISERKRIEQERENAFEEIKKLKDQLEQERDYLRDEIKSTAKFGEIIGESQALKRTLSQIESVAPLPTSVLILGESGVGKEMIARAIHSHSERADHPMVKVNCASIPKDLFESEFFGHVKGAFTGAHRDRVGRMQLANQGTLFLDEVGEIPLDLQGKLLRALQENTFERVGDDKTIQVDVRIIAATNRDLLKEVREGRFREDLYYRLSVFPIDVPALRERKADIAPLAQHFVLQFSKQFGRTPPRLTRAHLQLLQQHSWPGNIRELSNVIERAMIHSSGHQLRLDQALNLPEISPIRSQAEENNVDASPAFEHASVLSEADFKTLEKQNLINALKQCEWKIAGKNGAAALLGIKPSTLAYRMNLHGIKRPN